MTFILSLYRDTDADAAFRNYSQYLRENALRFPKSAYALATSEWWYDFNDHKCPHDAWLESACFAEQHSDAREESRSVSLTVRLLGAYQDGHIELIYPRVFSYQFSAPKSTGGHGDWRYDELRVNDQGHLIHEIEWAAGVDDLSWVIEASDVHYRWLPKG